MIAYLRSCSPAMLNAVTLEDRSTPGSCGVLSWRWQYTGAAYQGGRRGCSFHYTFNGRLRISSLSLPNESIYCGASVCVVYKQWGWAALALYLQPFPNPPPFPGPLIVEGDRSLP